MLLRNFTALSEKVDVYAFGTMVFHFLSTKRLYEEELNQLTSLKEPLESKIIGLVTGPKLPSLPSKIENSRDSTIIGLKNVMRQALQYNPNDRPTMQQIVNQLKGLYESPKQQKIVQNSIRQKLSYYWSNFDKDQ
jgi:serine/threonine protein kinase